MMKYLLLTVFCFLALPTFSQKTPYIPAYLLDANDVNGKQFTWTKTAQSDNFIIIWGDIVGTNPKVYLDANLAFDTSVILTNLEYIYKRFQEFGFANDTVGTNLSKYKIPVVMYNTWANGGATGYANGGSADGVMGAFWVHPTAMRTGDVAAHELAHAIQAQIVIDSRIPKGLGGAWDNAGIFWETHANFMRNLLYPSDVTAWGMDVYHIETWGDWKNTYENYQLLLAIMESDSIETVNRLWRESLSYESPLQAYKRLKNFDQHTFNDRMYEYVRRMPTFDFPYNNIGSYLQQYRSSDMVNYPMSIQALYTILAQDSADTKHYRVPIELAPEEFAYNIIPLYPDTDSCAVIIKFKGNLDANIHTGWRYGFVSAKTDGTVSRYGEMYDKNEAELGFTLNENETHLYLVVMGAPNDSITTTKYNDTWYGYPKHFRFPYELKISGAVPEGYQVPPKFRAQLKSNGHLHTNGGGWVDNTSIVDGSVYVAPHAIVAGNSTVKGNARIENTAYLKNANVYGNAVIKNNAFVIGGTVYDGAVISGQGYCENSTVWGKALVHMRAKVSNYKLHGNIEVGGDVLVYNQNGDCDNGVYYRMTNYYQDNLLECDNRTANHNDNADVNNVLVPFSSEKMEMKCHCQNYPGCLTLDVKENDVAISGSAYPNPVSSVLTINLTTIHGESLIELVNSIGSVVYTEHTIAESAKITVSHYPEGFYDVRITQEGKKVSTFKIMVVH